jgi:hypothetical protein
VEQVVEAALAETYAEAEALLLAKLASTTLADLSGDLDRRFPGAGRERDVMACTVAA